MTERSSGSGTRPGQADLRGSKRYAGPSRQAGSRVYPAINRGGSGRAATRQKRPLRRQQRLKGPSGIARAQVVPTELLVEFLVTVHDTESALDLRLAWVSAASLAHDLKSSRGPFGVGVAWWCSCRAWPLVRHPDHLSCVEPCPSQPITAHFSDRALAVWLVSKPHPCEHQLTCHGTLAPTSPLRDEEVLPARRTIYSR